MKDQEAKNLFRDLTQQRNITRPPSQALSEPLWSDSESGFPGSVVSPEREGDVMEGGIRVNEAIEWAKGKSVAEILEFSLSRRRILMTSTSDGAQMRISDRQFSIYCPGEEKQHLNDKRVIEERNPEASAHVSSAECRRRSEPVNPVSRSERLRSDPTGLGSNLFF